MDQWYHISNEDQLMTPAMVLFPNRIEENIKKMIKIAGTAHRLRPHVKTHKLPAIIKMQLAQGINKFKCATLAEMDLLAQVGAQDILLAYPLVGLAVHRFFSIQKEYPQTNFSTLVDNEDSLLFILEAAKKEESTVQLFIDINNGMNRTGIHPDKAIPLWKKIKKHDSSLFRGLHVYDGHIHDSSFEERKMHCDEDFKQVQALINLIGEIPELICGGSVSFPIHALYEERTLSPGTCLLWDQKYKSLYPDMDFDYAAILSTRVISKTANNLLTLDAGHKALASEMQKGRVQFFDLDEYVRKGHSEEHLVIETEHASQYKVGDILYGVPRHICPTMALHEYVYVAEAGSLIDKWHVAARSRMY